MEFEQKAKKNKQASVSNNQVVTAITALFTVF